jgi:perosamine synthetase
LDGLGLAPAALAGAQAVLSAAASDRRALSALAGGGAVGALEHAFATDQQVPFALAVSSGTAALHTALLAADLGPGDEVIVAAYGWGQTVAAVLASGATPVFADVLPDSGNLDPASAATLIGPRTRAILTTHLFGSPAPMTELATLATRHGLVLIADAAQALGARIEGRPLGSFGDLACFSLGAGKAATAGEGGLITCRSPDLYERLLIVCQHPLRGLREIEDPALRESVTELCLSYRLSPLQAAIGLGELAALSGRVTARRETVSRLRETLTDDWPAIRLTPDPAGALHSYHQIVGRYAGPEEGCEPFVARLQGQGFALRRGPVRLPLHLRAPFVADGPWYPRGFRPRGTHETWRLGACPSAEQWCRTELLIEGPETFQADQGVSTLARP